MATTDDPPAPRPRRRRICPYRISLVLLGITLQGCGEPTVPDEPVNIVRDRYASQADCAADWGPKPDACEPDDGSGDDSGPAGSQRGSTSHGMVAGSRGYFGPAYVEDARGDAQRESRQLARNAGHVVDDGAAGNRATGRSTVGTFMRGSGSSISRGGFGSSGRAFGASAS
jgi:hypothetical protein